MNGIENEREVVEEENLKPPTVSSFLAKLEEYRKEIWCDGQRTSSHTYPSVVEFVDKSRNELRLVGDRPITHIGCGCWTGIELMFERVEDDLLDMKALEREVSVLMKNLTLINAWVAEHGKLPEWGRDKSQEEKALGSRLNSLLCAKQVLGPLFAADVNGLLRQTPTE